MRNDDGGHVSLIVCGVGDDALLTSSAIGSCVRLCVRGVCAGFGGGGGELPPSSTNAKIAVFTMAEGHCAAEVCGPW